MPFKKGNPGGALSHTIDKLTPEARVVTIDGEDLRVAGNASENELMSKIMACQVRKAFQDGMKKKYRDRGCEVRPQRT